MSLPSLVALYNDASVNRITDLASMTAKLRASDLVAGYVALREAAPRRHRHEKTYFTGRTGVTSSGHHSNRREEHLAVALRNAYGGSSPLQLPGGRTLKILDYQTPLKARRADSGIGKIDLFGVIDGALPCVIELKVPTASGERSDTPLRAFLEAFAYCAIVEANIDELAAEAAATLGCEINRDRSALMVMAPEDYWLSYLGHPKAGDWWPPLERLATVLADSLGMESHFIALRDAQFDMGLAGNPPRLTGACLPINVADLATGRPDPVRSSAQALPVSHDDAYSGSLIRQFWDYVDTLPGELADELESSRGDGKRPPVFRKSAVTRNILMPPDATPELRATIEATLPRKERHRHFGSLRSSQALAQSVFGNLIAAGKAALLEGLETDEGLPAFFDGVGKARLQLENAVDHLGEPRSTSIDLWVEGSRRVAVECKFTEPGFGTCSRPGLRPTATNYARDYCNGDYLQQQGRTSRCSLTEIGVRYWRYIPELLSWDNATDLRPCPLGDTYQLVRNILAACITPDQRMETGNAHALVIYDARNPAFQEGGKANRQWLAVKGALRNPDSLRSCSWQRLLSHIDKDPELHWMVDALNAKYGFNQ